ncbi:MAG: hypothetical protein ABIP95_03405 [Pelobium sp.]
MDTIEKKQLGLELQELYLENKGWLSDVLFMEDEIRFFRKLFDKVISLAIVEEKVKKLYPVTQHLESLDKKRETLKALIIKNQHLLESLIKDAKKVFSLELVIENAEIVKNIRALFTEEKQLRKDLYILAEEVFELEHKGHLLGE